MLKHIDPLRSADLPERQRSLWQLIGPGAVLVGLSIGAGEIILWPLIAAEFGASMLWAAALGVFLQLWVNLEIGRWAISTGESVFTASSRVWRGFGLVFALLIIAQFLAPAWARSSGLALKALLLGPDHESPDWAWTTVSYAGVALVLFGPRTMYSGLEKFVMACIAFITVGLIFIAVRVGSGETLADIGAGVANVGFIDDDMNLRRLFGALVFAGAGGASNLFYAFYLRDKQIGMGARIPVLTNPFRGRTEKQSGAGFLSDSDARNQQRFRAWFRYLQFDQVVFFWLLNTVTMFLFIFGALAVLRPQGLVPESGRIIWDMAEILTSVMGDAGRTLFLLIGAATLFSTQLTILDGCARSLTDITVTSIPRADRKPPSTWYARYALGMIAVGILVTVVMEAMEVTELGFLFNAAYLGGFTMAIYTPLMLFINLRYLPAHARPRPLNIVMMSVASLVYVGFAVVCIGHELGLVD